jgi:hypothetical protein
MKRIFVACVLALGLGEVLTAATFEVEHDHLYRSCKGELVFSDATVQYRTGNDEHARVWKYEDIQQLRLEPRRITILTYEDRKIEFGADRAFNFKLLSGELNDSFRREIQDRLSRPLVSSVVPDRAGAVHTIPVRHRRGTDGGGGHLPGGKPGALARLAI